MCSDRKKNVNLLKQNKKLQISKKKCGTHQSVLIMKQY